MKKEAFGDFSLDRCMIWKKKNFKTRELTMIRENQVVEDSKPNLPVYTLTAPERTPEEIESAYAEIPPVIYEPPADRWERLPRTAKILSGASPILRIVMIGDSIIGDTSRSEWDIVLQRSYPKCRIMKVTIIRGSTGCWWYKDENRVHVFIYPHRPDLVIIGGISQSNDTESIRSVIGQARALYPSDFLLVSQAFGLTNPYKDDEWSFDIPDDPGDYRFKLRELADSEDCGFLDMTAHWGRYIRSSGRELVSFKRDEVHANKYGEQILGRILAAHLA